MDNEQAACFQLLACHDEERRMVAMVCVDEMGVGVCIDSCRDVRNDAFILRQSLIPKLQTSRNIN